MIHIGTLHYRDDRWIEIQLRYLERHTHEPYLTYASMDGIHTRHRARFDHPLDHSALAADARPGPRIELKLNALAAEMVGRAEADDMIVFLHGDTLPIADWAGPVRLMVGESRLAAIRRDENFEPIPHWSFCATTAGFWSEIGGDWSRGPTWDSDGIEATDTGAALWQDLERRGVEWHPILRSNRVDLHPVWIGVYGDLFYHHGAGFRTPMSRLDSAAYRHLPVPLRNLAGVRKRLANTLLTRRMYRRVRDQEDFYLDLT